MGVSLSIKDVPEALAEGLRARSARNHRSLQRELMALIEAAAATSAGETPPACPCSRRKAGMGMFDSLDCEWPPPDGGRGDDGQLQTLVPAAQAQYDYEDGLRLRSHPHRALDAPPPVGLSPVAKS